MLKNTIFFITSVINYKNRELSYSKIRSIYTVNDRIEHTLNTIRSIREKAPNSTIVLFELGITDSNLMKIREATDLYYYLGKNVLVRSAVDSKHKGLGEALGLLVGSLKFKNEFEYLYDYIFKISGRYYLNENFSLKKWETKREGITAKVYGETISTRLYGFPPSYFNNWIKTLIYSLPDLVRGVGIEEVLYKKLGQNIVEVKFLGVSGLIATDGTTISE